MRHLRALIALALGYWAGTGSSPARIYFTAGRIAAGNDRRFRAFESRTGKELWTGRLDMNAHAVPITYQGRDGKQYVAVVAAGASALDDPALPRAARRSSPLHYPEKTCTRWNARSDARSAASCC